MPRIISVVPLEDFELSVTFDDGIHGKVSLHDRLFGPVFEPLRDPRLFGQVFIDEYGAIAWPNGAELAPDALHDRFAAHLK